MNDKNDFMSASRTISIIGLGYIGLPTATILATSGATVIGVDNNKNVVETINRGEIHITEPGLSEKVKEIVANHNLRAATQPESAEAFLIAVPTPFKNDHEPNLKYVQSAAKSIAPVLKKGNIVILESTSPVGATEQMTKWLSQARPDLTFPNQNGESSDIRIAYCPERILPGHALTELVTNDRIIGGMTPACALAAKSVYEIFVKGELLTTHCRTAEMCKLVENAFRDVNIAFANELSLICDKLNINVWELIELSNRHPRVNILQPGPGVGGHCIAVDPWFLVDSAPKESRLIRTARKINDGKPKWVIDQVLSAITAFLEAHPEKKSTDVTLTCFGLAFKPNIDDLRESPALAIVQALQDLVNVTITVVEPNITSLPSNLDKKIQLIELSDSSQADIAVLLVDHDEFRTLPTDKRRFAHTIDTRGIWS